LAADVFAWIVGGSGFYFVVRALAPAVGPDVWDAVGIATLSTLLVLLNTVVPAGVGIQEFGMVALLTPWFPASVALVIAVAYRVLQTADDLVWIVLGYLTKAGTPSSPQ
jgi:uncharacterized membrane protein YbhN (UPF0104 family)